MEKQRNSPSLTVKCSRLYRNVETKTRRGHLLADLRVRDPGDSQIIRAATGAETREATGAATKVEALDRTQYLSRRFAVIVGIDPGLSGGVAILGMDGDVKSLSITPTLSVGKTKRDYDMQEMKSLLSVDGVLWAFIESQSARPGQGVSSTFKTGYGYGIWMALISSCEISLNVVSPRAWTSKMLSGVPGDGKNRNILAAKRLFPKADLRKSERARKPHDGIADALLIAEYGRRQIGRIKA